MPDGGGDGEDRPYRKGMLEEKAIQILQRMAGKQALNHNIGALLKFNFAKINASRMEAQARAAEEYREYCVAGNNYQVKSA
ncbi:MAG: hypothetical protein M1571_10895 [Firmicutes bacterium]|nr:hypothetical protein [Bacillota bacterium]